MVVAGIAISDLDSSCLLQWLTKSKSKDHFQYIPRWKSGNHRPPMVATTAYAWAPIGKILSCRVTNVNIREGVITVTKTDSATLFLCVYDNMISIATPIATVARSKYT